MDKESIFKRKIINYFTLKKINSEDERIRYNTIRNLASNFIHKKEVREYIFSRDGYKCCICGSEDNLTIDHIISVCKFADNRRLDIYLLNSEENLRTLCRSCNSRLTPNR